MINVTEPFLPPKIEYQEYLDQIWERNWLTNDGPLVRQLEAELISYLGLSNFLFVSNGTMALQLAIKALNLQGEIITTPFSFVATTTAIVWEGCNPVFVDIDPLTFNIDPQKIEASITDKTTAILATHVFGNPCDIEKINHIAKKYNLKVIYDAAHCFGTTYKGKSVLEYGDISCISFHATKVFHTIEGGGLVSKDPEIIKKLTLMRNFGHDGPGKFNGIGINSKNSEFHAAMGLCNLKYIDKVLKKRKEDSKLYDNLLLRDSKICRQEFLANSKINHSYYSILFVKEEFCEAVLKQLQTNNIGSRRYFYPTLNKLDYLHSEEKPFISEDIASRILCLPIYFLLAEEEISMIAKIITKTLEL